MNLAYKFPIVYWNTANLIVDSGGIQYAESVDDEIEVELAPDDDIENIAENNESSKTSRHKYFLIVASFQNVTNHTFAFKFPSTTTCESFTDMCFTAPFELELVTLAVQHVT